VTYSEVDGWDVELTVSDFDESRLMGDFGTLRVSGGAASPTGSQAANAQSHHDTLFIRSTFVALPLFNGLALCLARLDSVNWVPRTTSPSCIFCGSTQRITREDVISRWIDRTLPRSTSTTRLTHTRHSVRNGKSRVVFRRFRQTRAVHDVRNVCGDCNSQWMSRLESEVQQCLSPMLFGAPCTLDRAEQESIATWLTLKAMVLDADPDRDLEPVFEQADRDALRISRTIPTGLELYLIKYVGRLMFYTRVFGGIGDYPCIRILILGRLLAMIAYSPGGDYQSATPGPTGITLGASGIALIGSDVTPEYKMKIHPVVDETASWPPKDCDDDNLLEVVLPSRARFNPSFWTIQSSWIEQIHALGEDARSHFPTGQP
jgi:hypothetical protein